ncbi:MAG: hypothetical protein M3130_04600, partial [Actinomycetota bacterium]|nr:hypothetical protein [Actinomycetota bacterium]
SSQSPNGSALSLDRSSMSFAAARSHAAACQDANGFVPATRVARAEGPSVPNLWTTRQFAVLS